MRAATRTYQPSQPIWCAGCGHFGVLHALQAALRDLEIPPHETLVLAGIGCSGTIQNYVGAYGYHALHGRVLPAAAGVVLANPRLTVIAAGGDGDGYAIGVGHLVHAFRRNLSFVYVLMNNETYGLTKGQRSPGRLIDSAGVEPALSGPVLGLSIPATTFVARGYSGRFEQLVGLTRQALEHARAGRGFAFLEVVSPCVTYEDSYPRWEEVLCDVNEDPAYDVADRSAAFGVLGRLSGEGKLPTGLFFRAPGAAPPAPASSPATAEIDPGRLASRYRSILDEYAVVASAPVAAAPAADARPAGPCRVRPAAERDVAAVVETVNRGRLAGVPPAAEIGVRAALLPDPGHAGPTPRAVVAVSDGGVAGACSWERGAEGTRLLWLHGREDEAVVRGLLEHVLGVAAGAPITAFDLAADLNWGIPGLPLERQPVTHETLLALGFEGAERWAYLIGRPAPRAARVADVIRLTGPGQWTLTVLHEGDSVAEARVELGPQGAAIVRWIGVAEAFRGQGLGHALFDQATHLLGCKGARTVALYILRDEPGHDDRAAAMHLYRTAGFELIDRLWTYSRPPALPHSLGTRWGRWRVSAGGGVDPSPPPLAGGGGAPAPEGAVDPSPPPLAGGGGASAPEGAVDPSPPPTRWGRWRVSAGGGRRGQLFPNSDRTKR